MSREAANLEVHATGADPGGYSLTHARAYSLTHTQADLQFISPC
jgi:hypothetical protein